MLIALKFLVLVPLHYVNASETGLIFLPAFGVGAAITAPLLLFYSVASSKSKQWPQFHVKKTLLMGVLSGLVSTALLQFDVHSQLNRPSIYLFYFIF